jgi:hypothetical protein
MDINHEAVCCCEINSACSIVTKTLQDQRIQNNIRLVLAPAVEGDFEDNQPEELALSGCRQVKNGQDGNAMRFDNSLPVKNRNCAQKFVNEHHMAMKVC